MRLFAGLLAVGALLFAAPSALAAPPVAEAGFTCDNSPGPVTIVHPPGKTALIGDQRYVVASFSFTPTGGSADTHTFGAKTGLLGAPVTCTQDNDGGAFTVVLLPVPPSH